MYDAVTHRILKRDVRDRTELTLPADSTAVITIIPAGRILENDGRQLRAHGIVIDWRYPHA